MPQRALLRLLPQGGLEWLDAERPQVVPQTTMPAEREIVLLLPAQDVLSTRAPRVAKSDALMRKALPFAIEERLAAPVEQLHVAFAGSGDPLQVAVIERARLQAALDALAEQGLSARAAYAESALLPGSGPLLIQDRERALVRCASGAVLVEQVESLPVLLALLAEAGEKLDTFEVRSCAGSDPARLPPGFAERAQRAPALLALLVPQLSNPSGPNLLQGEFAATFAGAALPWLKRAAVLAALAVGLAFAHGLIERQQLQARIDSQRAEMAALLAQAMPGSPAVDPRAQLEIEYTRLMRGAGGDDALALLAKVAPNVAGSTRYTLEAIDYRAGSLELTLRAPDVATLDGLRATFAGLGLSAELTSATPGQGGVEGRIRLQERGA